MPVELKGLIEDELNVKECVISDNSADYITYELKPQLKTLGPKYGKLLGGIRQLLSSIDGKEVVEEVKDGGVYKTKIDGSDVEFAESDLLISVKTKEGYSSETDGSVTVILDTELNDELIKEGVLREIVSKIQTMRKEAGFEVTDHISVGYKAEGLAKQVLDEKKYLKDVLALDACETVDGYTKEWDINGNAVTLSVKKK